VLVPVSRLLLPLGLVVLARAQDTGAAAFRQACRDATQDTVVLNLAAHPDDEAAGTLVYLRRAGLRTVTLYTTSGEGGQNALGNELGDALAALRRRETEAAARHTGVEVRWLGLRDFGFSKTLEETLEAWGADELERRMDVALADIEPDVVFTNHGLEQGHGHHRATAWAGRRAIERLAARQRRSILFCERTGEERDSALLAFELNRLDPITGLTFARQAWNGLLEHGSQGPWPAFDPARARVDRWRQVLPEPTFSVVAARDELQIGPFWDGDAALRARLAAFAKDRPVAEHVAAARELCLLLRALPDAARDRRLQRRLDALERVLIAGHGVQVETLVAPNELLAGAEGKLTVLVHAERKGLVGELRVRLGDREAAGQAPLAVPFRAAGETLRPEVSFTLDGVPITLRPAIALRLVPPLEIAWERERVLVGDQSGERVVALTVSWRGEGACDEAPRFETPPGVEAEALVPRLSLSAERRQAGIPVRLRFDSRLLAERARRSAVEARLRGARAVLEVQHVAVVVPPELRVAVVPGADDTLVKTLGDLRVPCVTLDEVMLATADLRAFTTLVLDMRSYGRRPDLADHKERILQWCRDGGRVVALYHKPGEWNARPGRASLSPLALEVGDDRVNEEGSKVELLRPEHPSWNLPHRIGQEDFEGWVQERGLNFARKWDPAFEPLLALADRGEEPRRGALLCASVGRGQFVYCALALYRQWRIGHEGALRILVNLLTPAALAR
jgi:LmbE family N-acetylglucosaminyl deacetylase